MQVLTRPQLLIGIQYQNLRQTKIILQTYEDGYQIAQWLVRLQLTKQHVWSLVRNSVHDSRRAQLKSRILTGTCTLQSNRAVFYLSISLVTESIIF